MTAPEPIAMVLLAAGGSRRLGQPKQLLPKQGMPLVRYMASLSLALPLQRRMLITGAQAAAVEQALHGLPLACVHNPDWDQGMASSLRVAVQALGDHPGPCLFATIDQPALDAAWLQQLLTAGRAYPDHDIASGYLGLCGVPALLRPSRWRQALQLQGDTGLRRLLRQHPEQVHTLPAPALALDIDTPEQLALAIAQGQLDLPSL